MKAQTNSPEPIEFLKDFLASNRSEKSFTLLVESLNRLVFSGALRRTGNPQLAEEVTQSVFAILACKAKTLRRHPCLEAWAMETTRLEAATVMRTEGRRLRKTAALTVESEIQSHPNTLSMDHSSAWQDALPVLDEVLERLPMKDRKLILQRFYDEKKFREIASSTGQSEAACKMRLKRALSKLSTLLTARGVSLSVTVLATGLGTELARSAPLKAATLIAPKALAASTSISTTTIFTNTILTMSKIKTSTITAAAVIALASIPLSQQFAEGRKLQKQLASQKAGSTPPSTPSSRTTDRERGEHSHNRTPADILASLNQPVENRDLINILINNLVSAPGQDTLEYNLAWARIKQMSREEIAQLLGDLRDFPCKKFPKDLVTTFINSSLPKLSPQKRLESMIAGGRDINHAKAMTEWTAEDPDAALAWYQEKMASQSFDTGLNDDLHKSIVTKLIAGLVATSPGKALELYKNTTSLGNESYSISFVTDGFAKHARESGNPAYLEKFLNLHTGQERKNIIRDASVDHAMAGSFDQAKSFIDQHNPAPQDRAKFVNSLFRDHYRDAENPPPYSNNITEKLNWALVDSNEASDLKSTKTLLGIMGHRFPEETTQWLEAREPGNLRDHGYVGLANSKTYESNFETALTTTANITDAALRADTQKEIAQKWLTKDPDQAQKLLPADLLKQIQNQ